MFGRKKEISKDVLKDVVSVIILQQTNFFEEKSKWGMTFDPDRGLNGHTILSSETVPAGTEISFSVTYKDGHKEILKAKSGTVICDRLLQMALDPSILNPKNSTDGYKSFVLGKNQLPNGKYLIGQDIPAGTYDFTWIFGKGSLNKYKNDHDTTLGAVTYFQHVGTQHDYETRQCINVKCEDGQLLDITGTLVVQIERSKKVELDL